MTARLPASSQGHPELSVAWVMHALEPDEAAVFVAHLEGCAACRRIVAETEEVTTWLGAAVEPVSPPPSLRTRILEAAEEGGGGESETEQDAVVVPLRRPSSEAPQGRWIRRALAGLAVAAVLAVVVAVGGLVAANQSLSEQRDAAAAAAARGDRVSQLLEAAARPGTAQAVLTTAQGGFAGLVVDQRDGPEVLVSGLAPNDGGHTYVLWGLAGERPVGLTAFAMSGSGPVVRSVPAGQGTERFFGYAVSLEPGHAMPATPTQVVARGQMPS